MQNAVAVTVDLYTTTKIYTNDEETVVLNLKNLNFNISWNCDVLNKISSICVRDQSTNRNIFLYNDQNHQIVNDLLTTTLKDHEDKESIQNENIKNEMSKEDILIGSNNKYINKCIQCVNLNYLGN